MRRITSQQFCTVQSSSKNAKTDKELCYGMLKDFDFEEGFTPQVFIMIFDVSAVFN